MASHAMHAGAALALGLAALAMGGCSDRVLDVGLVETVMGKEAPQFGPTPIRSMSGEITEYPNLGSVPERPTDIPSPEAIQAEIRALEEQRAANRAAAEALARNPALPRPAAVPPTPDLRPGG